MLRFHLFAVLPLLVALSGCVVPAGPEWTDPESNFPPTISAATPPVGSILGLGVDGGASLTVEVVLADQNTQDNLYVRWIIDYPPYRDEITRMGLAQPPLPSEDQILRSRILFTPSCTDDQIAHGFSSHRLLLAVSDRPFKFDSFNSTDFPDDVPSGNFRVEGSWQFELDCK
jgi:hypothetical protein